MNSHYTHTKISKYQFWNDVYKLEGSRLHKSLMKFALMTELAQMTTRNFPPSFEDTVVSKRLVSIHQSNVPRFQITLTADAKIKSPHYKTGSHTTF